MRIAILGGGAIGRLLCQLIPEHLTTATIVAVVERPEGHATLRQILPANTAVVETVEQLRYFSVDIVIECAGHAALRESGIQVVSCGTDLLVVSVGALADLEIEQALRSAAEKSGATIRLPAGALGGLDVLGAAKRAGLNRVTYRGNKSPSAWRGTPAEKLIALDSITEATPFFEGNAREAAQLFPQNANVAAAVALAGIGFEGTSVRLIADPAATGNSHFIDASGTFGEISVRIKSTPLESNPKTSMLAPYSVIRSLANISDTVVIG